MKKKTMAVVLAVAAIGLLNGCQNSGGSTANSGNTGNEGSAINQEDAGSKGSTSNQDDVGSANNANDIGKDKAQEIALKDADVKEENITMLHISKDDENGELVYEVEFIDNTSQIEYEYEILASDGAIRQVNRDKSEYDGKAQNSTDAAVSKEEAIKKALDKVKGATESDIKIRIEQEDGRNVYDGEIIYNQKEYDFEIDAETGEILEWSEENM